MIYRLPLQMALQFQRSSHIGRIVRRLQVLTLSAQVLVRPELPITQTNPDIFTTL